MATTPVVVAPFTLKDVSLILGPTAGTSYEFRTQVSSVTLQPSSSQVEWTGLGLNTYTDVSTATWTCVLEYAQDWDTANSLSAYLYANEGNTVDVVFKAKNTGAKTWTGKVIITPGAVGGPVNNVATASVTLGMPAKPVLA
jgi:hypothetical protein